MHAPAPHSTHSRRPYAVGSLALIALTLSACASTLPVRGQVVMRDVTFLLHDFRLRSGLRVVIEEDHRAPVVAVVAVVGSGSSSDPAGKEGLAHLVEHLAFRSRRTGGPSAWARLEQLGAGRFNAFTSLDHTTYETLAPREALPELLSLEAQRLSSPLAGVTPEMLAVEREVVRNELRQRNEMGYIGQIFHWVQAASFPAGHPYVRPVVGTHDSLSSITLADAQLFARKHYQPRNMTLVITGDVDLVTLEALLKERLPRAWHGSGPPVEVSPRLVHPAPEPIPAPAAPKLVTYQATVPSPELYLTWVLPRGFDEASVAHEFVRAGLAFQLFAAIKNDGDIADIDTELIRGTLASVLMVRVVLKKGKDPEGSAETVLAEVNRLWSTRPGEEGGHTGALRFLRLRRTVFVGMALEAEDLLARARTRAELTHFAMNVSAYARTQAALAALSRPKLAEFARQWLQHKRARVFLVRPGVNGVPVLTSTPGLPPDAAAEPAPLPRRPPDSALTMSAPITSLRLANGVQVLLAPRPGLPLVSVGVALGGGKMSGQRRGVAEVAEWVSFSKSSIQGEPGDFGLRSSSHLSRDHLRYTLAGASGNIGNVLAILGEQLSHMGTTFEALRFYNEHVLPGRKTMEAAPEERAYRALKRALYGEHPYGQSATAKELGQVTRVDVGDWLEQVYHPSNALVVIAGEFDPQQVIPLVHEYLGDWGDPGTPVAVPALPPLPKSAARPELLITPHPGAPQSHVQVACRLPETTPEAAARYALMASMIRARMWHHMRERRGATYGFETGVSMSRGGAAHLQVEGVVDSQHLESALTAAREALAPYAQGGVPEAELEAARGRLLAEHAVTLTTSSAWVDALLDTGVLGWDADVITRKPALLQAVTSEALRQEFAGCLERVVVSVIGDEGPARSAAEAAFP